MVTLFCSSPEELFRTTADLVTAECLRAVRRRGFALLTLAGGSTPRVLYELLAGSENLPWDRVHLLWGDERVVPQNSIDSNFRMAHEALISRIPIPDKNVHRVNTELGADRAASDYESQIRSLSGSTSPMLDVVLLGLGPDGHTASLFPGQPQLHAKGLVASTPEASREPRVRRVTMTFELLSDSALVVFLVSGEEKTPIVRRILAGEGDDYPASRIRSKGNLVWAVYPPPQV